MCSCTKITLNGCETLMQLFHKSLALTHNLMLQSSTSVHSGLIIGSPRAKLYLAVGDSQHKVAETHCEFVLLSTTELKKGVSSYRSLTESASSKHSLHKQQTGTDASVKTFIIISHSRRVRKLGKMFMTICYPSKKVKQLLSFPPDGVSALTPSSEK